MDIADMKNVHVLDHPLLKHKITKIRRVETQTNEFREIVKEIAVIEGLEALREPPTHDVEIQTPIEKTIQPVIDSDSLCFVPILRAGLATLACTEMKKRMNRWNISANCQKTSPTSMSIFSIRCLLPAEAASTLLLLYISMA